MKPYPFRLRPEHLRGQKPITWMIYPDGQMPDWAFSLPAYDWKPNVLYRWRVKRAERQPDGKYILTLDWVNPAEDEARSAASFQATADRLREQREERERAAQEEAARIAAQKAAARQTAIENGHMPGDDNHCQACGLYLFDRAAVIGAKNTWIKNGVAYCTTPDAGGRAWQYRCGEAFQLIQLDRSDWHPFADDYHPHAG